MNIYENDFPQLDLRVLKIRDKLMGLHSTGMFAEAIRYQLFLGKSLKEVCQLIIDHYLEDKTDTLFVVEQETIDLIKLVYGYKTK